MERLDIHTISSRGPGYKSMVQIGVLQTAIEIIKKEHNISDADISKALRQAIVKINDDLKKVETNGPD